MKLVNFKILSFTLTLLFAFKSFAAKVPGYPFVSTVQGQAWVTAMDSKRQPLKARALLKGRAEIETSLSGEVRILWDASRALTIYPNSEVLIPAIAWETGEAPVVLLKSGSIRWEGEGRGYNVALRSDLFEFLAPPADFILSMDPEKARAEVRMFKGVMDFSCLNGDESVKVRDGEKASFQGVLEEGKVAYDILLKGRKIPRGKLSKASALSKEEKAPFVEAEKERKKAENRRAQQAKAEVEQKKQAGQICDRPLGKFNDCAWVCEGNPKKEKKSCVISDPHVQCVRRRCNANGEWAEDTVMDAEKAQVLCKAQPVVAPCDY